MNIFNDTNSPTISKPEIEQIVKEKMEFYLLGTYVVGRGYKLFSYNPTNDKIEEVEVKRGDFIQGELTTEGWIYFDPENYKTTVDSRNYYFQALNLKLAKERVRKFKEGKIQELFNLKKPNPDGIDFFKPL